LITQKCNRISIILYNLNNKHYINLSIMRLYLQTLLLIICLTILTQNSNGQLLDPVTGNVQLPYNRLIQPAGKQILFGDEALENHALDVALSPDGKWLAVEERYSIVFISTQTNQVIFTLPNNLNPELSGGMNTFSGIQWFTGNSVPEVYWSVMVLNRSFVASAKWDGQKALFGPVLEYHGGPPSFMALPNEIIVTNELGRNYIYVVFNGINRVIKQDLETKEIIWSVDPGVAPYGLTMASGRVYVTNWAGRHPEEGDKEVAGVPWGLARVNNNTGGSTREGSVAVIDANNGTLLKEIIVGLHPNEICSDKRGRFVYVTNSNSDNVSVINTNSNEVSETISVRLQPEINPYFGDSPNGLCLSTDESTLFVANGMDNALAVIRLGKKANRKSDLTASVVTGYIPTGAYPSGLCQSASGILYVANLEAEGVRLGLSNPNSSNLIYNSHHMLASVSVIPVPDDKKLRAYTDTVVAVNDLARATMARETPRKEAEPKPLPDRIGEPSVFKHVLYIIKENRTYDQILGDMQEGNGDSTLCIFGEGITPNAHKLAREFLLLDNYNVSGKCSAEGHQWTDAAIVTDYIEKNMRAWFRSYPHVQTDALVYSPTGFLWDDGVKNGKSVRIYGEASIPIIENNLQWKDVYERFINGDSVKFTNVTTIEPVKKILSKSYPSYGNHEFTDIMRADAFIRELKRYEELDGDHLPELMIMALPNDHTGGIRPGLPTPRAMVTDNDLAFGQIVEAITKSRFWPNTVIFVTEDDSQGGWDHVSAYRTVGLIISPFSRMKKTISTYYTQPSMVRTIEQILGLPPMNIQDAIANPMADCFTSIPDLTPYDHVKNNIPINEMNPSLTSLSGRALHFARKSMLPEFDGIDSGNDDLLNRILWFAAKGNKPYPSKYAGAKSNEEDDDNDD
jgi:YVTN family beta-propeller protein